MTASPIASDFLSRPVAALTGGTGFLGRYIVRALDAAGYRVRLLARGGVAHPQIDDLRVEVVPGGLEDEGALLRLVSGAQVVIHAAGAIKASRPAGYVRVNEGGARRMADAIAMAAPDARIVLVSSLAAREPHLSAYAASKRAGEAAFLDRLGPARVVIVRPPGVYGPWDRETLAVFQAARGPVAPMLGGPDARIALIHAADAAAAVVALSAAGTAPRIYELSDERCEGYGWSELVDTAAAALGTHPMKFRIPRSLLFVTGALSQIWGQISDRPVMMNTGKVREILHPAWSVSPESLPPNQSWRPEWRLLDGFIATAAWYRQAGWLL